MSVSELRLRRSMTAAAEARGFVLAEANRRGLSGRAADAELAVSELATNALVHTRGEIVVRVDGGPDRLRVEVRDGSQLLPMPSLSERGGMSGRGLLLVSQIADSWGATPDHGGKAVWFEVSPRRSARDELTVEALLELWSHDEGWEADRSAGDREVLLPGLPTAELVAVKARGQDLGREMALIVRQSRDRSSRLVRLARRLDALMHDLAPMRVAIRTQALAAAARGEPTVDVRLRVSPADADRILDYADSLDEADELAHAGQLLTVAPPRPTAAFRRSYLRAIAAQLRSGHPGGPGSGHLRRHGG